MTNENENGQRARATDPKKQASESAAEWVDIDTVVKWERNPRKLDGAQLERAKSSLRRWGWCAPAVGWRSKSMLVAGHARIAALRSILFEDPTLSSKDNAVLLSSLRGPTVRSIPLRWREFASLADAEAYALRDNKSLGDWLESELSEILESLPNDLVADAGFDDDDDDGVKSTSVDMVGTLDLEFVINVRGPMRLQPEVLERLRADLVAMDDDVSVQVAVL